MKYSISMAINNIFFYKTIIFYKKLDKVYSSKDIFEIERWNEKIVKKKCTIIKKSPLNLRSNIFILKRII